MGDRDWRPFTYGGIASCVAEFGTFPIDVTKTRLQVQGQKLDKRFSQLRYDGMVDCFFKIVKEEGVQSLYAGIWPAVLRQATYGTIKFGTYYSLKSLVLEHGEETVAKNVVCAVIAGAVSSAIANPTDVIKVRMQVAGATSSNVGLLDCFKDVYAQEGLSGLWRGVSPTAQRAAVIAAIELPVYDFCKGQLIPLLGDRAANHFISSLVASFGSAVGSTPIDVVRTRLMNQRKLKMSAETPLAGHHLYTSTLDCFVQTFRNEGFWAFYKGFVPTWFRMGPWNIIFFVTYEQLKKLY